MQQLEGIHHISSITGDAARNVDFYVRVLGMRMVKKTVNQDEPSVYHLFYADEQGSPGADMTFFEYPGARRGRAGAGMINRIVLRVGSEASLDYWRLRLADEQIEAERDRQSLRFDDPEGLGLELIVDESGDPPLTAVSPDVPAEHAIRGFAGVRVYSADPARSAALLRDVLGFAAEDDDLTRWEARGEKRGGFYQYETPPEERGVQGAGTVHHIAFASYDDDIEAWNERVTAAGGHTSGLVDRFWFRSVYFREPSGVLFELATLGPGFTSDEPLEHLGETLVLPPKFEHLRAQIEPALTPLPNPRAATSAS
ncbi:ring-cleaving dioxygenase [Conexibacter woesei]|uniref:Glyoxalase/bleomycin resistance protein/dioxygenase n=1 Tax=Conexibacter woesei (strain DSM 14684 / CCUG 47730 / CIP 108061 / JCM 11494 / NBRC 100937 / ID131577) TaxID=469383 RepID=D3FA64_CONWI|nr:ring-cleaving dioxygenase [Conexibacter woesei]ADB53159.1 Glyoxalase/bleomycin resistance protein/dioxygenase [Conexibacter woesei DSM 14684]